MAYTGIEFPSFGGLNLNVDPQDVATRGAMSMLNADLGRLKTTVGSRAGLARLGTGSGTYHDISPGNASVLYVFKNNGSTIVQQVVSISTGVVGGGLTWGGATSKVTCCAPVSYAAGGLTGGGVLAASRAGASNGELQAIVTDSGGTSLLSGMAFYPRYVAVTPLSQRAACAHYTSTTQTPSGANGTPSTVFFSNAGALDGGTFGTSSFPTNNYIGLYPNDGEEITGIAVWQSELYVLKRSNLFIFYGESIDSSGNPIFNFRRVPLPSLARVTSTRGGENIVSGRDGVYLLLSDGMYRLTGSNLQLVSRQVTPLFDGSGPAGMILPTTAADWTFSAVGQRVYLSYPNGATYRTLVYDADLDEWLLWDLTAGSSALPTRLISWQNSSGMPTAYLAAGAKVFTPSATATSDDGTAITSSYQTGFWNPGQPSAESVVREWLIDGSGTIGFKTAVNDSSTLGASASVALGTWPAVTQGRDRRAVRGRNVSFEISGTALWSVSRVTANLRGQRSVGLKAT